MDTEQLLAPEDSSPLGRSRADVLDMLRAAGGPLGVREIAEGTGLHPNTARFHLEALAAAGLASREAEDRESPGRPRIGYRAAAGAPAGQRRYRLLAEMLTGLVAAAVPGAPAAAEAAGREWGAYLADPPPPCTRPDAGEAIIRLTAILEELGFAPETGTETGTEARTDATKTKTGTGEYRLCLRHCPFREVAHDHQDVICALHLGLMRGALDRMGAPLTAERLDPFVEPSLCVAVVTGESGQSVR